MQALEQFSNTIPKQTVWFDEGPIVRSNTSRAVNATGIDTSLSDPFRQGVEITQLKHFDVGTVKTWAGDPGHVMKRCWYGQDHPQGASDSYKDLDYFDPYDYIRAQQDASSLYASVITYPVITSNSDNVASDNYDGVIEPLTIRSAASFSSIDVPFEAHAVRASRMSGNERQNSSTDDVVNVDCYDNIVTYGDPYIDLIDYFNGLVQMNACYSVSPTLLSPFNDSKSGANDVILLSDSMGIDVVTAMLSMNPGSDNYLPPCKRSSTSGWMYDSNAAVGTDSLAFGGMTH